MENRLPYAKKVIRSPISSTNVQLKINIPIQQVVINESRTHQKRGRLVGSKDRNS